MTAARKLSCALLSTPACNSLLSDSIQQLRVRVMSFCNKEQIAHRRSALVQVCAGGLPLPHRLLQDQPSQDGQAVG